MISNNNNDDVKETWPSLQDDQEASSSSTSSSPAPLSEAPKLLEKSEISNEQKMKDLNEE